MDKITFKEIGINNIDKYIGKKCIAILKDKKLGRASSLSNIYREVEGYAKALSNPHWKDKVRQVLQMYPDFVSESRGIWSLAA